MSAPPYHLGKLTPRLAPTEQATAHDFIWAAGFYEGEGSIGRQIRFNKGQTGQTETITLPQKDTWTLQRMRALFGGSVRCYDTKSGCSVWCVSGARARGFIQSIYGLLSPRRQEQARKALKVGEYASG